MPIIELYFCYKTDLMRKGHHLFPTLDLRYFGCVDQHQTYRFSLADIL